MQIKDEVFALLSVPYAILLFDRINELTTLIHLKELFLADVNALVPSIGLTQGAGDGCWNGCCLRKHLE